VQGAENVALSDKCPNAGQKALPGNILQLYNPRPDPTTTNNLLRVNDKIVVTGVVENATQVEVHLFREALEFNEISKKYFNLLANFLPIFSWANCSSCPI